MQTSVVVGEEQSLFNAGIWVDPKWKIKDQNGDYSAWYRQSKMDLARIVPPRKDLCEEMFKEWTSSSSAPRARTSTLGPWTLVLAVSGGIVVGGALLLVVAAVCVWFRRRRQRRGANANEEQHGQEMIRWN